MFTSLLARGYGPKGGMHAPATLPNVTCLERSSRARAPQEWGQVEEGVMVVAVLLVVAETVEAVV